MDRGGFRDRNRRYSYPGDPRQDLADREFMHFGGHARRGIFRDDLLVAALPALARRRFDAELMAMPPSRMVLASRRYVRRAELRDAARSRIARILRVPHLGAELAEATAVPLLQDMKAVAALWAQPDQVLASRALAEFRDMSRLCLTHKLR